MRYDYLLRCLRGGNFSIRIGRWVLQAYEQPPSMRILARQDLTGTKTPDYKASALGLSALLRWIEIEEERNPQQYET